MRNSIAIVGRPNVGKSTLFNTLVGSRIAIEADTPGVTRDRVLYPLHLDNRIVDLIDTGGIGMVDRQNLAHMVDRQIEIAITESVLLIFLVDCRDGITPLDTDVATRLRRSGKKVLLVANKADTSKIETLMPSFHALGFGDALPVSAKQHRNLDDLEQAILAALPPMTDEEEIPREFMDSDVVDEPEDPKQPRIRSIHGNTLKIAFVGRRNVGKSSIINQLCGDERVIVSDVPGTTRDSVDITIEKDGEKFVAIDTAGMRKRGQMDDVMEFYGHLRTERAIHRADVVVLMLDCTQTISRVDKQISARIIDECKPCIVTLNKWDLAVRKKPGITVESFQQYIADQLSGLWFSPMAGVSARDGTNVWNLIQHARRLAQMAGREVKTGAMNSALASAQRKRRPRPQHGKIGKIYYGTQVGVRPPTFLLFCNNPRAFDQNYRRYLHSHLRKELGFPDIPLRLVFKVSRDKELGRYG